jgi:hypothetical protein
MEPHGVTIDTSVFKDYLNPDKNKDDHIDKLLSVLAKRRFRLCVDADKRIENEYDTQLGPTIRNQDEARFERQMLQFWLVLTPKTTYAVNMGDDLMVQLKRVIMEHKESLDRIFVYVAITANTKMVTNDGKHIVDRRKDLRRLAKKRSADLVDFLTSQGALDDLANWPG